MDRRTFLVGLLGGLAVTPTLIAAASSVEAAPLPEATSSSTLTEADLEAVNADWTQAAVDVPGPARRRVRRGARRVRRTARRGVRRATRTSRRTRRVMRRRGY